MRKLLFAIFLLTLLTTPLATSAGEENAITNAKHKAPPHETSDRAHMSIFDQLNEERMTSIQGGDQALLITMRQTMLNEVVEKYRQSNTPDAQLLRSLEEQAVRLHFQDLMYPPTHIFTADFQPHGGALHIYARIQKEWDEVVLNKEATYEELSQRLHHTFQSRSPKTHTRIRTRAFQEEIQDAQSWLDETHDKAHKIIAVCDRWRSKWIQPMQKGIFPKKLNENDLGFPYCRFLGLSPIPTRLCKPGTTHGGLLRTAIEILKTAIVKGREFGWFKHKTRSFGVELVLRMGTVFPVSAMPQLHEIVDSFEVMEHMQGLTTQVQSEGHDANLQTFFNRILGSLLHSNNGKLEIRRDLGGKSYLEKLVCTQQPSALSELALSQIWASNAQYLLRVMKRCPQDGLDESSFDILKGGLVEAAVLIQKKIKVVRSTAIHITITVEKDQWKAEKQRCKAQKMEAEQALEREKQKVEDQEKTKRLQARADQARADLEKEEQQKDENTTTRKKKRKNRRRKSDPRLSSGEPKLEANHEPVSTGEQNSRNSQQNSKLSEEPNTSPATRCDSSSSEIDKDSNDEFVASSFASKQRKKLNKLRPPRSELREPQAQVATLARSDFTLDTHAEEKPREIPVLKQRGARTKSQDAASLQSVTTTNCKKQVQSGQAWLAQIAHERQHELTHSGRAPSIEHTEVVDQVTSSLDPNIIEDPDPQTEHGVHNSVQQDQLSASEISYESMARDKSSRKGEWMFSRHGDPEREWHGVQLGRDDKLGEHMQLVRETLDRGLPDDQSCADANEKPSLNDRLEEIDSEAWLEWSV